MSRFLIAVFLPHQFNEGGFKECNILNSKMKRLSNQNLLLKLVQSFWMQQVTLRQNIADLLGKMNTFFVCLKFPTLTLDWIIFEETSRRDNFMILYHDTRSTLHCLIFVHTKNIAASGPLHLLFPLFDGSLPRWSWSTPSLESLLKYHFLRAAFPDQPI